MTEYTPGQEPAKTPIEDLLQFGKGFYGGKIKSCSIEYDDSSFAQVSPDVMAEACRRLDSWPDLLEALESSVEAHKGPDRVAWVVLARDAIAKARSHPQ